MIYVPHDKSNKVNVRMKVMNVKSSSWKTVSLSTVHSSPTVIQFESYGSLDGPMVPEHATLVHHGGHGYAQHKDEHEAHTPRSAGGRHRGNISAGTKGLDTSHSAWSAPATRGGVKRRLYAFLTVDSRGSRILTVTESRRLVERLKAGQVVWNVRRLAGKESTEQLKDGEGGRRRSSLRQSPRKQKPTGVGSLPIEHEDVRLVQKGEEGKSKTGYKLRVVKAKEKTKYAQIPWLGISFQFVLPKITLTWTTQSDVILALHLSSIKLSSFVTPTRLARLSGGATALEKILISGSSNHHRSGDGDRRKSAAYWWNRSSGLLSERKPVLEKARRGSSSLIDWSTAKIEVRVPDQTMIPLRGATKEEQRAAEREWKLREWARNRKIQQRRYLDLKTEIFTNSEVRMDLSVGAIHCDHFVEGDVPVILKSTNGAGANEEDDFVAPFFSLHITKSVVDPTFAPIYDDIEVKSG